MTAAWKEPACGKEGLDEHDKHFITARRRPLEPLQGSRWGNAESHMSRALHRQQCSHGHNQLPRSDSKRFHARVLAGTWVSSNMQRTHLTGASMEEQPSDMPCFGDHQRRQRSAGMQHVCLGGLVQLAQARGGQRLHRRQLRCQLAPLKVDATVQRVAHNAACKWGTTAGQQGVAACPDRPNGDSLFVVPVFCWVSEQPASWQGSGSWQTRACVGTSILRGPCRVRTFSSRAATAAATVRAQAHQLGVLPLQAAPARRQHTRRQLRLRGAAVTERLGGVGQFVAHGAVAGQVIPAEGGGGWGRRGMTTLRCWASGPCNVHGQALGSSPCQPAPGEGGGAAAEKDIARPARTCRSWQLCRAALRPPHAPLQHWRQPAAAARRAAASVAACGSGAASLQTKPAAAGTQPGLGRESLHWLRWRALAACGVPSTPMSRLGNCQVAILTAQAPCTFLLALASLPLAAAP